MSVREHAPEIALSWLWFFLILLSYYCLKPLRDGLASSQAQNLGSLYLATFISSIMGLSIYSRLVASIRRQWLLLSVYQFFAICLVLFGLLFAVSPEPPAYQVIVFFVWVSVFSLFVVTLFWSVMADVFTAAQAKAWFGIIAAAGSIGSISGSAIAYQLSQWFGSAGLIVTSIMALELSVVVGLSLLRLRSKQTIAEPTLAAPTASPTNVLPPRDSGGTGGSVFAGFTRVLQSRYLLGICLFVALGKFAATFVYNNLQLVLFTEMPLAEERTTLFSQMNLYAQSGSLFTQALLAGLIMRRLGVTVAMLIPCVAMFALFTWLTVSATLSTLVIGQVMQQILGYGLLTPAQHVLFTVVSREDKYKSKAFTDIVVFRGSDVAAGKACDLMIRSGSGLSRLAVWMLPVLALWATVAVWTGRRYARQSSMTEANTGEQG